MPLEVFVTPKAHFDIEECRQWWSDHRSAEQAERWQEACLQAIDSLSTCGAMCALARENRKAPVELRQIAIGIGRRPTHRAVFAIRPDKIVVYRVRHLAQQDLSLEQL